MLISLILHLRSTASVTLPAHLGRANYAAALAAIGRVNPDLAAAIHDGDGPKPLTCSGLWGVRSDGPSLHLSADQTCAVRITRLTPAVTEALTAALLENQPPTWELDNHPFHIDAILCDPAANAWSTLSPA